MRTIFLIYILIYIPISVLVLCIVVMVHFIMKNAEKTKEIERIRQNQEIAEKQKKWNEQQKIEQNKIFYEKIDHEIRNLISDADSWKLQRQINVYRNDTYIIIVNCFNNQKKYIALEIMDMGKTVTIHENFHNINEKNKKQFLEQLYRYCENEIKELYHNARRENIEEAYFIIEYEKNIYLEYFVDKILEYHYYTEIESILGNRGIKEWWQLPIFGECYTDTKGIYLARTTKSDIYLSKHKTILYAYDKLKSAEELGQYAEIIIPRKVFWGYKSDIFWNRYIWNAYIPSTDGADPEIDCIVLCSHGIFCFECKHRILPVSFSELQDKEWYDTQGNGFRNPLLQNSTHVKALKEFLQNEGYENLPIYNIIAFYGKTSETFIYENREMIAEYEDKHPDTLFGNEKEIRYKLIQLTQKTKTILTKEQITELYSLLYSKTQRTEDEKQIIMERKLQKYSKPV